MDEAELRRPFCAHVRFRSAEVLVGIGRLTYHNQWGALQFFILALFGPLRGLRLLHCVGIHLYTVYLVLSTLFG